MVAQGIKQSGTDVERQMMSLSIDVDSRCMRASGPGVTAGAACAEDRSGGVVADMMDTIEVAGKCRQLHTDLLVPSLDDAIPRPPFFCVCIAPTVGARVR